MVDFAVTGRSIAFLLFRRAGAVFAFAWNRNPRSGSSTRRAHRVARRAGGKQRRKRARRPCRALATNLHFTFVTRPSPRGDKRAEPGLARVAESPAKTASARRGTRLASNG